MTQACGTDGHRHVSRRGDPLRRRGPAPVCRAIESASTRLVSAVTRVELACVVEGRKGEAGRERLERFFALTGAEVVAVTPQQATLAIGAFRTFGKGRHPAGLNIGDCFSYALASATDRPLLFRGNDFVQTDVRSALT